LSAGSWTIWCANAGEFAGQRIHSGGAYVNMEGPRILHPRGIVLLSAIRIRCHRHDRSLGEAKLCREAEICYVNISLVTDFDCWHEDHEKPYPWTSSWKT
jgi:5'-methylthioadenosine phosphorylase